MRTGPTTFGTGRLRSAGVAKPPQKARQPGPGLSSTYQPAGCRRRRTTQPSCTTSAQVHPRPGWLQKGRRVGPGRGASLFPAWLSARLPRSRQLPTTHGAVAFCTRPRRLGRLSGFCIPRAGVAGDRGPVRPELLALEDAYLRPQVAVLPPLASSGCPRTTVPSASTPSSKPFRSTFPHGPPTRPGRRSATGASRTTDRLAAKSGEQTAEALSRGLSDEAAAPVSSGRRGTGCARGHRRTRRRAAGQGAAGGGNRRPRAGRRQLLDRRRGGAGRGPGPVPG